MGVAAEDVDEALLRPSPASRRPSPRAGRSRRSPGSAPPRRPAPPSARTCRPRGGARGGRSSVRWPRSARCPTRRRRLSPSGPGAGSSRIQRPSPSETCASSSSPSASTAVSATSPPLRILDRDPLLAQAGVQPPRTRPASSAIRTSWSWRMCGRRADRLDAVGLGLASHRDAVVEVARPVVDRVRQDVAVEVDHRVRSLLRSSTLSALRPTGATGRSGTAPSRHRRTMIGKIMDLFAPGLREQDLGFNSWIRKRPAEGTTSLAPTTCSSTASSASPSTRRTSGSGSSRPRSSSRFVDQGLSQEELDDLLDLAVSGEIAEPSSAPRRAHQRELGGPGRSLQPQPRPLDPPPRLPRRLARPAGQGG